MAMRRGLTTFFPGLQIFKLAQGEYVAVERVEANYKKLPIIAQLFVYGNSMESMLVAVVVPEENLLLDAAKKEGISGSYTELLGNPKTKEMLLKQMEAVAAESKMRVCSFQTFSGLAGNGWSTAKHNSCVHMEVALAIFLSTEAFASKIPYPSCVERSLISLRVSISLPFLDNCLLQCHLARKSLQAEPWTLTAGL